MKIFIFQELLLYGNTCKNLDIYRIRLSEISSISASEGSLILRKISPPI